MDFTLNADRAKESCRAPSAITESGAYIGQFHDAYYYTTRSGAGFMVFNFFANDGRSARLNMCITKRDGSDSFARGIVDAVMTVLRKRSISSTLGVIKYSTGNSQDVERFHDLEGKKIGVILQRVNDPSDEKYPFHMELLTPFDADTRMNAREILEKAPEAKAVDARLKTLSDRTLKKKSAAESFESPKRDEAPAHDTFVNEDIPF
jgi:hypothetical protein